MKRAALLLLVLVLSAAAVSALVVAADNWRLEHRPPETPAYNPADAKAWVTAARARHLIATAPAPTATGTP